MLGDISLSERGFFKLYAAVKVSTCMSTLYKLKLYYLNWNKEHVILGLCPLSEPKNFSTEFSSWPPKLGVLGLGRCLRPLSALVLY